ncbi:MAG: hypothetical protein CO073_01075 [Candidatus Komeilibacteria bacterium CG_4_9_14_0_8_um_filter_36_9]|uniref:RNA polymerase sigma factor n=2 Tax=Candidatus Komeiliibacteriota TaxID=1817908 RepID=A0A2M8DRX1_9BACT|nr:MAG: hypothetical protein COY67_03155 [Candidatus Komeilibacteria bacterium CG_4_10_14_0_8_um_filter_37_78]PJC02127.1 MAG: hypothetical protein CO073_01075 [Candidatus Komeilibacteria bacterium CG_4_9_14_0_8_um_filter_36_9]
MLVYKTICFIEPNAIYPFKLPLKESIILTIRTIMNPKNQEDAQLVAQAKNDKESFQLLYQKYNLKVYNYFWYRVGYNKEIAEDLTQETFIRAFSSIDRYQVRQYSYLTFLLKIAHNLLINHFREKPTLELNRFKEISSSIVSSLNDQVDIEIMWQDIDKLSFLDREVLHLRYHYDLSVQEIAKVMNRSENAIKLILSRSRKRLSQQR